jgi:hypothetical protein
VPFANDGTPVADFLENLSNVLLFQRNSSDGVVWINSGIGGEAESVLIAAGQKPGTAGATWWIRDASFGEADPILGDRIQVWSGDVSTSIEAHIVKALVIG